MISATQICLKSELGNEQRSLYKYLGCVINSTRERRGNETSLRRAANSLLPPRIPHLAINFYNFHILFFSRHNSISQISRKTFKPYPYLRKIRLEPSYAARALPDGCTAVRAWVVWRQWFFILHYEPLIKEEEKNQRLPAAANNNGTFLRLYAYLHLGISTIQLLG